MTSFDRWVENVEAGLHLQRLPSQPKKALANIEKNLRELLERLVRLADYAYQSYPADTSSDKKVQTSSEPRSDYRERETWEFLTGRFAGELRDIAHHLDRAVESADRWLRGFEKPAAKVSSEVCRGECGHPWSKRGRGVWCPCGRRRG